MRDAFDIAMDRARVLREQFGIYGWGWIELRDPHGHLIEVQSFANAITTAGDEYYAKRGVAGIGTPNLSQPTLMNGMKLGTGTTAAAKSGAGAALVTYESASNNLFDTTHPATVDETGDTGWSAEYKNTWGAGDVTETALTEAVIVNDANTDATSSAANTISRVVFTAINKGASDSLAITWKHTFNAS
jgi:hypothetical protein